MPSKPRTVRQAWLTLFTAFMAGQVVLVGLGLFFALGGNELGLDASKKLDAMQQVFQSCTAIGVIACITLARAKLNANTVQSPQDLFRGTVTCLSVGEMTVLVALVGLSKLHLTQFLIAASLVFIVDFGLILPLSLKLLGQPAPKN
ncbi:MAG: hypothetical protein H7Y17_12755 [Chlorobia bacterium]|nr:hypothetical protein [Fimbriimonadaceae bacterium]